MSANWVTSFLKCKYCEIEVEGTSDMDLILKMVYHLHEVHNG